MGIKAKKSSIREDSLGFKDPATCRTQFRCSTFEHGYLIKEGRLRIS